MLFVCLDKNKMIVSPCLSGWLLLHFVCMAATANLFHLFAYFIGGGPDLFSPPKHSLLLLFCKLGPECFCCAAASVFFCGNARECRLGNGIVVGIRFLKIPPSRHLENGLRFRMIENVIEMLLHFQFGFSTINNSVAIVKLFQIYRPRRFSIFSSLQATKQETYPFTSPH